MGQSGSSTASPGAGLCLTPACLHATSSVLQNLANQWQQFDPCTQFDKMVCGGAAERFPEDSRGVMNDVYARNNRILRKILESPYRDAIEYHSIMSRNNIDEQNFNLLQQTYQTCIGDAATNAGSQPLVDLLTGLGDIWPIQIDDTTTMDDSEYENLANALLYLEQNGVSAFRTLKHQDTQTVILSDPYEPEVVLPLITQPMPAHSNVSIYNDPAGLESYAQNIATLFAQGLYPVTTNLTEQQALNLAEGAIDFEFKLLSALGQSQIEAQLTADPDMPANLAGLQKTTIDTLTSLAPALAFDTILSEWMPDDYKLDRVLVSYPSFYANLSDIIDSSPRTNIQSWFAWRMIVSLVDDIVDPLVQSAVHSATGTEEITDPRWEQCVAHTTNTLTWILDRYYVSAAYTDDMRSSVDQMATTIKTQFTKRVSELDWMTDEVKKRAINKANNIQQNIGFPTSTPDIRSADSLASYYQDLEITDDHFANVLTGRRHNMQAHYDTVAKPTDRSAFPSTSTLVNAFYSPFYNSMYINAGISQLEYWHPGLPSYAIYGGLGSVVGHEITHGFDSNGHKWDEKGAAKPWFDNTTRVAYQERTQCFVDQYNQYEVDISGGNKATVDGLLTLGENLSDAGGLRIAFDAWKSLEGGQRNDLSLPGLEGFTHDQLFYVFFAQAWCNTKTPASVEEQLTTDNHSPHTVRIIGGVENSRGFKEAFNCPVKEPKCEVF